jgi:hypothetical protein
MVAGSATARATGGGIGPSGAARLIGDIGDIHRFADRAHFASWNGTAPIGASSGDQQRHRLSRAGTAESSQQTRPGLVADQHRVRPSPGRRLWVTAFCSSPSAPSDSDPLAVTAKTNSTDARLNVNGSSPVAATGFLAIDGVADVGSTPDDIDLVRSIDHARHRLEPGNQPNQTTSENRGHLTARMHYHTVSVTVW